MKKTFILVLSILTLISYSQQKDSNTRPKIGLTLSGGGAKGLAHIGVLKVMEEAGIRPDYITGTSMGSIIGALYAIGYSPEELEQVVKSSDWDKLMGDYISRRDLAMTEKANFEKFVLDLPIKKEKHKSIKFQPQGMHSGFNITMFFSELTERVENIENFSDFEIPFAAIAADIEHGESVILNKGSLPIAMRASMAIPSVFSPVMINDTLLVDGGLLNNFPVKECRDMGADIIIGIDVQSPFYVQEDLYSVLNIFQQSSKILRKPNNELGISLTDYYIQPDVTQFSVLGFNNADTIIKLGEIAGRKMMPQFKELAAKYNLNYVRDTTKVNYEITRIFKLKEIKVNGLENVSRKHVIGRLNLDTVSFISYSEIKEALVRLRGSDYFSSIYFKTINTENGSVLEIDVIEKTSRQLKVGVNYNTISKASVLLSYISKNLLIKGSRLELIAKIGQEPAFYGDYLIDNGWKPGFGLSVKSFVKNMNIYEHRTNNKLASFDMANILVDLYTQSTLYNALSIGGGGEYEATLITQNVSAFEFEEYRKNYYNIYGFLKVDNVDQLYFPNKGTILDSKFKMIFEDKYDPRLYFSARFVQVVPVVKNRLHFIVKAATGTSIGEDIPIEYLFTTNEFVEFPIKSFIPFVGLRYNQRYSQSVAVARLDLRYQIFKNNYITLISNLGSFAKTYEDIMKNDNTDYLTFGMGLEYSIQTLIGPVTFGVAESDFTHEINTYFSLGFQF